MISCFSFLLPVSVRFEKNKNIKQNYFIRKHIFNKQHTDHFESFRTLGNELFCCQAKTWLWSTVLSLCSCLPQEVDLACEEQFIERFPSKPNLISGVLSQCWACAKALQWFSCLGVCETLNESLMGGTVELLHNTETDPVYNRTITYCSYLINIFHLYMKPTVLSVTMKCRIMGGTKNAKWLVIEFT